MIKYTIPVIVALVAFFSSMVTSAPIAHRPSVQMDVSPQTAKQGANFLESSFRTTDTNEDLSSNEDRLSWPYISLADVCEPVIKCMCYLVPPESKTPEMEHLCLEYDTLSANVCELTTGAQLFHAWWFGSNAPESTHYVEDCIPSMFDKYNWVVSTAE